MLRLGCFALSVGDARYCNSLSAPNCCRSDETAKDSIKPFVLKTFENPHLLLLSICLATLRANNFHRRHFDHQLDFQNALEEDPLLDYAYRSWDFHAHEANPRGPATAAVTGFVLACTSYLAIIKEREESTLDLLFPLHVAVQYGFESLISPAAKIWPNGTLTLAGRSPLHLACQFGKYACVEALLKLPSVNVNLPELEGGRTPLMMPCPFPRVLEVVLNVPGIDVNAVDREGRTALRHALDNGHAEAAKLLVEVTSNGINAADCQGNPALIRASLRGRAEAAKFSPLFPTLTSTRGKLSTIRPVG